MDAIDAQCQFANIAQSIVPEKSIIGKRDHCSSNSHKICANYIVLIRICAKQLTKNIKLRKMKNPTYPEERDAF